ncbi:MAG: hypothetical protein NAG76_03840 [Candidatus Pristimantibacillus lignocellulolyticus]|uniref:Uncharacterized protein n=1 Tax=Candidatus Pristimantibacillus lignocellulolyticus TaxID=2994561 RepID=A0A9J6ZGT4_9BACL|nr:MAG: hypothetical protein NAG76_03840 [Candidatus Pristimantibacillus lignocellulolyticus]
MTPNQNNNQPSKAEVQTTKLNKVPTPENNATDFSNEFSAEVAAEVFEQSDRQKNNKRSKNQQ